MKPLDRMHMALGEFLTEMGRLELRMLVLGTSLSDIPMEYFFEDYAKLTFGPKITWFAERCEQSDTMAKYKAKMNRIDQEMKDLLKKRNYLTHGETYEESFRGRPRAPYRVGVDKKTSIIWTTSTTRSTATTFSVFSKSKMRLPNASKSAGTSKRLRRTFSITPNRMCRSQTIPFGLTQSPSYLLLVQSTAGALGLGVHPDNRPADLLEHAGALFRGPWNIPRTSGVNMISAAR
ncbi:hypothetical protein [Bradyrhizobium sp. BR 1433]|uniref:hypothetical protein n=1 Tax=Bradyrhizobium sp. BR 1433 TaxID=3447967 RepID=UPI003EE6D416